MPDQQSIRRAIELEYWVVDESGRLVEPGELVEATPGAEQEFVEPLLEIKTTPCTTTEELRSELYDRLRRVIACADNCGKRLVPLATPLNHESIAEHADERTRIQNVAVGDSFRHVRPCAGTHIHIEQQPNRAIDQLNTMIAVDPAFALVNSARHCGGESRVVGARSHCYRRLAYDGVSGQGKLWPYLKNREEWDRRLQTQYEAFRDRALAAGIAEESFEECFDLESAVWIPVKLRDEFNTVEWRSPDTGLPSEMIRLTETLVEITATLRETPVRIGERPGIDDSTITLPPFERVASYVDSAISDGLTPSVRSYLSQMGFQPAAYNPIAEAFDPCSLSVEAARTQRLQHADRLREDSYNRQPLEAE